jgi:hypothetical protein
MISLMLWDRSTDDFYKDNQEIDRVLKFIEDAPSSKFHTFLATKSFYYTSEDLHEIKAINYFYLNKIDNAIQELGLSPSGANLELNADPFMIHIWDCHDCDFQAPHTKYTKLSFLEKMKDLQNKVNTLKGEQAAQANFELANGFYNATWYGNARSFFETKFSNFNKTYEKVDLNKSGIFNMQLVSAHYQKALELSGDKEFKAKMTYMLAKAERNDIYSKGMSSEESSESDIPKLLFFRTLKDEYSDTQYYQEVIKECGYFKKYLGL